MLKYADVVGELRVLLSSRISGGGCGMFNMRPSRPSAGLGLRLIAAAGDVYPLRTVPEGDPMPSIDIRGDCPRD